MPDWAANSIELFAPPSVRSNPTTCQIDRPVSDRQIVRPVSDRFRVEGVGLRTVVEKSSPVSLLGCEELNVIVSLCFEVCGLGCSA